MRFAILSTLALMASTAVVAQAQTFEIIDGTANVSGQPSTSTQEARASWNQACEKWKSETKELNKNDQVMLLSCESPTCAFSSDTGKTTCESNANFKVKTIGTRAQPPQPVAQEPQVQEREVIVQQQAPPPMVVYEPTPAPRLGFLWVGGFWGWHMHHRMWNAGHWERRPSYVWNEPGWEHHDHDRDRDWHHGPGFHRH